MPYDEVMGKFKRGTLHSGSDKGPQVTNRKQAVAIMMSEKKKAGEGKKEYMAHDDGGDVKPIADKGPPIPPPRPSAGPGGRPPLRLPIPKSKGKGTLIVPDKGKEEWEPSKPKEKPGGGMFPIGGQSREEWEPQQNPGPQSNFPGSTEPRPDIERPIRADTSVTGVRKGGKVGKYAGGGLIGEPSDYKFDTPHVGFSKGGEACQASNSKQFKQNILETAVNPTEPIGFNKGGDVGYKKPSWRRW